MCDKIIPFPNRRPQTSQPRQSPRQSPRRGDGATPGGRLVVSEETGVPVRRVPPGSMLADGPLSIVLGVAGHSRACVMRIRSGQSMTCSCDAKPEELDDAAKAVGQAIRFARMAATRRVPMPHVIIADLIAHVDAGNAAAVLVWQWLVRRGQIPTSSDLRPRLRLVSKRA